MSPPRKSIILIVGLLASLSVLLYVQFGNSTQEAVMPEEQMALSAPALDPALTASGSNVETLTQGSYASAPRATSDPLAAGYRWDPNNPGYADSEVDAAWLEAHGYPGPEVETYLLSLPLGSLKSLAEGGNKPAQAVYGYKLAQSGASKAETQDVLLESAASGSVYALKMAGDIYQAVDSYRDPVMASAFYGLQARRGDQMGLGLMYMLDGRLSTDQRLRARAMEESLWRNRLARTNSSQTIARPGFQEALSNALHPTEEGKK